MKSFSSYFVFVRQSFHNKRPASRQAHYTKLNKYFYEFYISNTFPIKQRIVAFISYNYVVNSC